MTITTEKRPPRWPTPWPSGERGQPDLPVVMLTVRDSTGIDYLVRVGNGNLSAFEEGEGETVVWETRVNFGATDSTVAGGSAFRLAAREQADVAERWAAAIIQAEGRGQEL